MTNPPHSGTNAADTGSAARRVRRVLLGITAVWLLVHAAVNSVSVATDLARRGIVFEAAQPWIWEFSSALSLFLWLLPVLAFDEGLRKRVRGIGLRLAAYAAASVVFSVAHVATMVAMRHIVYRLAGWHYDFGPWRDGLLYEYRKDVLTFVVILAIAAAWRLLSARIAPAVVVDPLPAALPAAAANGAAPAAPTFIVRTATQGDLLVRADEVDWIEAQGNYVALHVGSEARLLRQTLAEMETRLKAHGFIRTHRRALVNRQRMQAIIPPELGELGVRLSSGQVAPLSESRRAEVVRLVLGA